MTELTDEIGELPLRYLHEVASRGGVRLAAESLGVNASVVSRQIAKLERHLRFSLIERQGRGVVVTEIGQILVKHYQDGQLRQRDLAIRLQEFRHLKRGRISIGSGEGFVDRLISSALQGFSRVYPHILVDIRTGSTAEIIQMLREDEIDMGLGVCTNVDPAIKLRLFQPSPLCALVKPGHLLTVLGKVTMQQLQEHRLIFMAEHFGVQRYLQSIMDAERLDLSPAYRCDLFSTAQSLAEAGLGVAFMSAGAARRRIEAGQLVAIPIDHPIAKDFSSQLMTRVGRRLSPAADHFWKEIVRSR